MSADELEQQVLELSDTVELLTLDKEQLLFDKELLEEKVLQLQEELNTAKQSSSHSQAHSAVNVQDSAEYQTLQAENDKLREALFRLNTITTQVKEENKGLHHQETLLNTELQELRLYQANSEAEVEALRQSVDSMSDFENMIEKLSQENVELTSKVQDLQQTVTELEETLELNEALDHQQRQQLDANQQALQHLTIQLNQVEQKLQEKDLLLSESNRKSDQLKELITSQKKELDRLQILLSTEFQENQDIATKLQDAITLRVQYEELQQAQVKWKSMHFSMLQEKCKFQVFTQRYDFMFGNQTASVSLMEEMKGLNSEVLAMTTLTASFEVQKVVTDMLQTLRAAQTQTAHDVFAALAQLLSLQDAVLLPWILTNIKDSVDVKQYTWNVSLLMRMKALFQRGHVSAVNASIAVQDWLFSTQQAANLTEAQQSNVDMRKAQMEENITMLWSLVDEVRVCVSDLLQAQAEQQWGWAQLAKAVKEFFQSRVAAGSSSGDLYANICLESMVVLLSNVVESSLSRSANNAVTKSVKVEVDVLLKHIRRLLSMSSTSCREAVSMLLEVLTALGDHSVFAPLTQAEALAVEAVDGDEDCWKAVLVTVRKLAALAQVHDASAHSSGNTIYLRYLPVTSLFSNVKGRDETAQEEQHQLLQDKYWSLLHVGHGQDLLLATHLADSADSTTGNGSVDAAWKTRLAPLRQFITARLSAEGSSSSAPSGPLTPTKNDSNNTNTNVTSEQTVSKQQYQQVLQQLDIKRDELKSALNRCEELQTAFEQAVSAASSHPGTRSTTPKLGAGISKMSPVNSMQDFSSISSAGDGQALTAEEAAKLKKDLKAMEDAFATIELKAEQLNKENKTLKAQVVGLGGTVEAVATSNVASSAATAKDRPAVTRRRSQLDIADGSKVAAPGGKPSSVENDLLSLLNSVPSAKARTTTASAVTGSSSSAATTSSNPSSVTAANYQLMQEKSAILTEQANHWRRVALKRLSTTLLPLENPSMLSPAGSGKLQLGAVEVNLPGIASNEAQDVRKLHQQLRVQRAKNVRISKLSATAPAASSTPEGAVSHIRRQGLLRRGDIIYRLLSQTTLQL